MPLTCQGPWGRPVSRGELREPASRAQGPDPKGDDVTDRQTDRQCVGSQVGDGIETRGQTERRVGGRGPRFQRDFRSGSGLLGIFGQFARPSCASASLCLYVALGPVPVDLHEDQDAQRFSE